MSSTKKTTIKKEPQPFSGEKPINFYYEKGILSFAEDISLPSENLAYMAPGAMLALIEGSELFWPGPKEYHILCLDGNKNIIAHAIVSSLKVIDIAFAIRVASFCRASSIVVYTINEYLYSGKFTPGAFESKLINTMNDGLKWINCKVEDFIIIGGGEYIYKFRRPFFSFRHEGLMPDEILPIL